MNVHDEVFEVLRANGFSDDPVQNFRFEVKLVWEYYHMGLLTELERITWLKKLEMEANLLDPQVKKDILWLNVCLGPHYRLGV